MDTEQRSALIDTQTLHKNRPMSPHLSIYRLQLTSGLSILHRITGAYLYIGLIILAWAIFGLVYFPYVLEAIAECIYSTMLTVVLFKIMLFAWTFSLFYHQFNGIRHLFWDIGKGFELSQTYNSGRLVMALSVLVTVICWLYVFNIDTFVMKQLIVIE